MALIPHETYELESILYGLDENGYVLIPVDRVLRLLDRKQAGSSNTWKRLLDAWENMPGDRKRDDLYIVETRTKHYLLTKQPLHNLMTDWACEPRPPARDDNTVAA